MAVFPGDGDDTEGALFQVYIFQCRDGFRFFQGNSVAFLLKGAEKMDEGIDDKGIVLTGYLQVEPCHIVLYEIMVAQFVGIGNDFICQLQKFDAFCRQADTAAGTLKDSNAKFLFQVPYGFGQTGLGYVQMDGCLVHGTAAGDFFYV